MTQGYKYSWTEMEILSRNWRQFAKDNFGQAKTIGVHSFANLSDPILRKFELKIPFMNGEILFSTSEFKPLKVNYRFSKKTNNDFLIYPEDFTDSIAKLFGTKEIELGDKKFDDNFFVTGSSKRLMEQVLNYEVRVFLLNNYISNFKLTEVNKADELELTIVINELETAEMTKVLNLFKTCIQTIEEEIESGKIDKTN